MVCVISLLFVGDAQSYVTDCVADLVGVVSNDSLMSGPRGHEYQRPWRLREVGDLTPVIDEISGECESEVPTSGVSTEDDVLLVEAKINEVRVTCQGVDESSREGIGSLCARAQQMVLDGEGTSDG